MEVAADNNKIILYNLFNTLRQDMMYKTKRTLSIIEINDDDLTTLVTMIDCDSFSIDHETRIIHVMSSRTYKVPGDIIKTTLSTFGYIFGIGKVFNHLHDESVTLCDGKYIGDIRIDTFAMYATTKHDNINYLCFSTSYRIQSFIRLDYDVKYIVEPKWEGREYRYSSSGMSDESWDEYPDDFDQIDFDSDYLNGSTDQLSNEWSNALDECSDELDN